jgi:predicted nicotinamide N-methyase
VAIQVDDDQPTFWDRVEAGAWEPGTLLALQPLLGPGVLFLDIGAWVGPLSLFAAGMGARVIAVEADPRAEVQLRRNLAANPDFAHRVTVMARAAAPIPGRSGWERAGSRVTRCRALSWPRGRTPGPRRG